MNNDIDRFTNCYSTSEKWTGKYWIDGKKIYSKSVTYNFPNSYSSQTLSIPIILTNIDSTINIYGTYKSGSGIYSVPLATGSGDVGIISFGKIDSTSIQVRIGGTQSFSNSIFYVTIEYTKTTD